MSVLRCVSTGPAHTWVLRALAAAALVVASGASVEAQTIPRLPVAPPDTVAVVPDTAASPVPLAAGLDGAPAPYNPAPMPVPPPDPAALATAPLPRVALVSTQRPVVLLRGASHDGPDPVARPITEATVQVDAEGRRTLVYSERPAAPPDVGAEMGCGPAADRAVARVGTLAEALLAVTDEGPLVGAAQQLLCVAGYAVPQDGVYGEAMERAVLAFQEDLNAEAPGGERLVESGVLDPQTRRVLEARVRVRLSD